MNPYIQLTTYNEYFSSRFYETPKWILLFVEMFLHEYFSVESVGKPTYSLHEPYKKCQKTDTHVKKLTPIWKQKGYIFPQM